MMIQGKPEMVKGQGVPCLHLEIQDGVGVDHIVASPDLFYQIIADGIKKFLAGDKQATNEEQKRLAQLARTTVKGALLMFGDKLLDGLYGSKNHPKPQKGDDIIEWYSMMFAKVALAGATQGILRIEVRDDGQNYLIASEVRTLALPEGTGQGSGSEGRRETESNEGPCLDCGA